MEQNKHVTAILALTLAFGMGLAAYIAASDRPTPSPISPTVTAAAASDDPVLPPVNTTPPGNTPTPTEPPFTLESCDPTLAVARSTNASSGAATVGVGREIGRFTFTHRAPTNCASYTGNATVREVVLTFQWGGLSSAAAKRAALRNIELRSADRRTLYGRLSSVLAAGSTPRNMRIFLRPTLPIPAGSVRELVVIADTTNAAGGSTTPTSVELSVTRTVAELPNRTHIGSMTPN